MAKQKLLVQSKTGGTRMNQNLKKKPKPLPAYKPKKTGRKK